VLDGDPVPPKGAQPPIFSPCLLWPNGWMDQDATWYGGRSRSRRHCVRWGTQLPLKRGTAPSPLSAHVYCGQMAIWIKMPLGTKVGLGPGDIVLNRDPATPKEMGHSPQFLAMSIVAKRSPISAAAEHLFPIFTVVCRNGVIFYRLRYTF